MPTRCMIHSSLVSTIFSRSAFVSTFGGTYVASDAIFVGRPPTLLTFRSTTVARPFFRRHASARRPVQKAVLNQERLVDVFDGVLLFADRGGNAADADGTAAELVDDRPQQLPVDFVEPVLVDFEHLQGRACDIERHAPVRA